MAVWRLLERLSRHLDTMIAAHTNLCARHDMVLHTLARVSRAHVRAQTHIECLERSLKGQQEIAAQTTRLHHRCCICMTSAATHGYMHGDSVHYAVCKPCSGLAESGVCVVCREPAVLVAVYQSGVSPFEREAAV